MSAKAKRRSILADKVTGDNICKALIFFDKMYEKLNKAEKREFLTQLISEVQVYEESKPSGQWLKSIEFKLPIIEHDMELSLDNDTQIETVCLLGNRKPDSYVELSVDMEEYRKIRRNLALRLIIICDMIRKTQCEVLLYG